jgi:hypothetical protein
MERLGWGTSETPARMAPRPKLLAELKNPSQRLCYRKLGSPRNRLVDVSRAVCQALPQSNIDPEGMRACKLCAIIRMLSPFLLTLYCFRSKVPVDGLIPDFQKLTCTLIIHIFSCSSVITP